jgi:hypothetical protein
MSETRRAAAFVRRLRGMPPPDLPAGRSRSDWVVVAVTLVVGGAETLSSGLGWPALRAIAALVMAGALLQRRRAPLAVLAIAAGSNLVANVALQIAGHFLLISGLMLVVAVYALVRWASGRDVLIGTAIVAVHAGLGRLVDPNWSAIGALLFAGLPVALALTMRAGAERRTATDMAPGSPRWPAVLRVAAVGVVALVLVVASGGVFVVDQIQSYITRTRSPAAPDESAVDAAALRRAAEAGRGTHGPDGAIIHTVDYAHQLLAALEQPTFSVEADVTVIDGEAFLQHDPRDPVGLPLLEFLEYAAIAEFPIVKLDLKRDRVGPIIDEVHRAVDEFGLDPAGVQFNADVFRGPGVDENVLGARTDLSFADALYNLVVMELETADLVRIARSFPEATIVISATPPKQTPDHGYLAEHLEHYLDAAAEIRAASPSQPLVFAVRGDLAARSGASFLDALHDVERSSVAAWWAAEAPPAPGEIETLLGWGVTFLDVSAGES